MKLKRAVFAVCCFASVVNAQIVAYAPSVAELQALIDGGASYIVVRNPTPGAEKVYETDKTIRLRDNLTILCEPGVVIQAAAGAFKATGDVPDACLVAAVGVSSVAVRGCTFRMRKAEYTIANGYPATEFRHAISLTGCTNVELTDVAVQRSGGDGVYVGPLVTAEGRKQCKNLVFRRLKATDNYRQGVSLCSCDGMAIEDSEFAGTKGTAPQAGIDIEPSSPLDVVRNIRVARCISYNNGGSAYMVNVTRLNATSAPVGIEFDDCKGMSIPAGHYLIRIEGMSWNRTDKPPGTVKWDGSVWP